MTAVAVGLSGCAGDDEPTAPAPPSDPGLIHVHGLGRNPADGALMVATHTGLFRVAPDSATAQRVADNHQDTMGFSVVGPDHFLGSGHPGSTDDPPFLGLIESRNGGAQWRPISLRGEVDFHVLEARGRCSRWPSTPTIQRASSHWAKSAGTSRATAARRGDRCRCRAGW